MFELKENPGPSLGEAWNEYLDSYGRFLWVVVAAMLIAIGLTLYGLANPPVPV